MGIFARAGRIAHNSVRKQIIRTSSRKHASPQNIPSRKPGPYRCEPEAPARPTNLSELENEAKFLRGALGEQITYLRVEAEGITLHLGRLIKGRNGLNNADLECLRGTEYVRDLQLEGYITVEGLAFLTRIGSLVHLKIYRPWNPVVLGSGRRQIFNWAENRCLPIFELYEMGVDRYYNPMVESKSVHHFGKRVFN